VQAHYDAAQGILDAIDAAEARLESSEHVKGKQFLLKKFERLRAEAEDIKANGDKIDGELGGDTDDAPPADTDDDDSEAAEESDLEADMSTDEDGTLKAIRPVYARVLKARRRFKAHEIDAGLSAADAEADARLEKARRKFRRQSAING
jgi:hypothetical protein